MNKQTITGIATYRAATTERAISEHLNEIVAKNTKMIEVGPGSIISIRHTGGLSRHSLPIMLPASDERNTYDKNVFLVDTFGLRSNEADFMYTASVLSAIWEDVSVNESFNSVNRLAANIYVKWLSSGYIRQFGLGVEDSDGVKIVAGLYYYLQGRTLNENDFSGDEVHRVIRQVAEATDVPDKRVKDIIESSDLLSYDIPIDFNWYLEALSKVSDILAYRMNSVTALTTISNSFYRGMVAPPQLALNYRPFFVAMLYTVLSDRSAARTGLDVIVKATLEGRRRQQAETFVKAVESIMRAQLSK